MPWIAQYLVLRLIELSNSDLPRYWQFTLGKHSSSMRRDDEIMTPGRRSVLLLVLMFSIRNVGVENRIG